MEVYNSFEEHAASFLDFIQPVSDEDLYTVDPFSPIAPGTVCSAGDRRFIVLASYTNGTVAVLSKDILRSREFGTTANWKESDLRRWLHNNYYLELAADIGAENIIPIRRNLLSLDGLDYYGECEDMVSLLTVDEYRKFHKTIGLDQTDSWWWLITPWSVPELGYTRGVCCVSSDGAVDYGVCGARGGVRPFCILNSFVLSL